MKKVISSLLACSLMFALASISFAEVKKGMQEILVNGSASLTRYNGGEYISKRVILGVGYGVFLTDAVETGVSVRGTTNWSDTSSSAHSSLIADGFVKYHFNTSGETVPYVGLQAGCIRSKSGNNVTTNGAYGGMAGIKWFVKENISFFTEYNASFSKSISSNSPDITHAALFGIALYL